MTRPVPRHVLPDSAAVGDDGWLTIGGCSARDLAADFGTPLFVYDEAHLRSRCGEAVAGFPDGVAYATKAFLCRAMARLALDEGMRLDVASSGELHVALAAGATGGQLVLHGNNKSEVELRRAREAGATIVIDSFDEIDRLEDLHRRDGLAPRVLVRITPGVEAHTHEFIRTGQADSKFGFGVDSGDATKAIDRVRAASAVAFHGVHLHIGSQVFVADFFHQAIDVVAPFVREHQAGELSIGGGLGVAYVDGEEAPTITQWARSVRDATTNAGIEARITAEPGRAIVATAAITMYTVGTIKELPGIRTYLSVDGGMSDNPRPVLYGSGYEAFLPRGPFAERPRTVRVVGKHCESGDVLVREARVPADVAVGDLLATPVTGAYGHSMGSNYNKILRPAVVFASGGNARLVVRRETEDDLLLSDLG
ncbi:MAG TPA: diaminopimelate decarboxylase [Acidimicrobiales bacterium]|jgi:diaminopimelate decarboxylase|nr:diaminopimelate decarboxylase [Acidimicrobiales bacterium]